MEIVQVVELLSRPIVGRRCYWRKLSPSSWNALCWMGVGLVSMVSG